MRQITPYALWLGNVRDAEKLPAEIDPELTAMVDLTHYEARIDLPRETVHLRFPLIDGAGNASWRLRVAIEAVASLLAAKVPTFVYCGLGMSRTPTVAAFALALTTGRSPEDCLSEVAQFGSIDVNPGLWQSAKELRLTLPAVHSRELAAQLETKHPSSPDG